MQSTLKALALSITLATLAACSGQPPPAARTGTPPALPSVVVHRADARQEQVWDGVVEAVQSAVLSAQTVARVVELPYDVNDVVPRGAVLVRFTDVEQKSAARAAQAQIASARAAYVDAEANYTRMQAIFAKGLVARAALDQATAQRDSARAALNAAEAQYRSAGTQQDYTVVRAPFAGVITQRFVHVGESVQAGPPQPQPLIAIASLESLRVTVQVPQSAVAAIRRLHAADVVLDGGRRRLKVDTVTVFPYADPQTHTFSVRLLLAGDERAAGDNGLFPGMTVKVAFATGDAKRLTVPDSALVQRGELQAVYVIGADGVSLRQVRTGERVGERIEVLSGLDDGERVVTDPAAAARWRVQQHKDGAS